MCKCLNIKRIIFSTIFIIYPIFLMKVIRVYFFQMFFFSSSLSFLFLLHRQFYIMHFDHIRFAEPFADNANVICLNQKLLWPKRISQLAIKRDILFSGRFVVNHLSTWNINGKRKFKFSTIRSSNLVFLFALFCIIFHILFGRFVIIFVDSVDFQIIIL